MFSFRHSHNLTDTERVPVHARVDSLNAFLQNVVAHTELIECLTLCHTVIVECTIFGRDGRLRNSQRRADRERRRVQRLVGLNYLLRLDAILDTDGVESLALCDNMDYVATDRARGN